MLDAFSRMGVLLLLPLTTALASGRPLQTVEIIMETKGITNECICLFISKEVLQQEHLGFMGDRLDDDWLPVQGVHMTHFDLHQLYNTKI